MSRRGTRSWGRWPRPGQGRPVSQPGTGSAWPGWRGPTGGAGTAGGAWRTCAPPRCTPGGTSLAGTPSTWWPPTPTCITCRTGSATSRPHRCCAPGSSATGRCCGPRSRRAGGSGCGGSAGPRTWPPRSRWPRARPCTCSPAGPRRASWRSAWARRPRRAPSTRRPSRWTRPSSSRPPGTWSRSRWPRWTAAARWPWPASTCPRSRRWTTPGTCSRSGPCAASPRTPGATPRSSSGWPGGCGCRSPPAPYPLDGADRALADLAAGRVRGAAVLSRRGRLTTRQR